MAQGGPDDRRLRAAVLHVARIYLEVERGLRSPDHLAGVLARGEYQRHRRAPMEIRHPGTGPVAPDDIRGIHIDRSVPGQVTASVNTREAGDRWGALTMHFRERREGWVVDHLQRLPRRGLRAPQKPTTIEPNGFRDRVRRVEEELRLVGSARRGVQARLDDVLEGGDGPDNERQLREQLAWWTRREADLGEELVALNRRRSLHERLGLSPGDRDGPVAAEPPDDPVTERLVQVLGPRPDEGDDGELWDSVYGEVHTYRRFWEIDEAGTLLGGPASTEWQQRHRDHVVDLLRSAATHLRARDQHTGREKERRRELGGSFGIEP